MLKPSNRQKHIDERFDSDVSGEDYGNQLFLRVVAKQRQFKDVVFKYTIFDTCYFRNCVFVSCDFTGCRFSGTNLLGSTFSGCKFDYAIFERTQVDKSILDVGFPGWENLSQRFARTLRTNYQSLGDVESAKKALAIELEATEIHLYKAWSSNESYYRNKHKGPRRIEAFLRWQRFKALDLIWGNGESTWKLIRAVFVIFIIMSVHHVLRFGDPNTVASYLEACRLMPGIFLGVSKPEGYSDLNLALISIVRLVAVGFFLSTIVKRFGRR